MIKDIEVRRAIRTGLLSYMAYMNNDLLIGRHHRIINKTIKDIATTTNRRIIFTLPPRHGKTFMLSQHMPAWYLMNNPNNNVILATYGQELANDFGRYARDLLSSDLTVDLAQAQIISKDSTSKKRFNTLRGGGMFSVGRGGPITGRGADLIVIDDIVKNLKESLSPTIQKETIDWYKSVLYTRLMKGGNIIVIGTRWNKKDLIGHLLEDSSDKWEIVDMPAIDQIGDPLWPEMFDIERLESIRSEIGTKYFTSLYQQKPTVDEGAIIKRDWIQYYDKLPKGNLKYYQSWDLSFKGNDNSDYVAGTVWAIDGANKYLIDIVHKKMDFVETLAAIRASVAKHPQTLATIVEDAANGAALHATLKKEIPGIILWKPKTSKEERVYACSPQFEAGNIYLPKFASWVEKYVEELLSFPHGQNDDLVDSTTMLILLKGRGKSIKFGASGTSVFNTVYQDI